MTAAERNPRAPAAAAACAACLRRSWLLQALSPLLDYHCRGDGRLIELLALADEQLLQALGGRRRSELNAQYARFDPRLAQRVANVEAVCRHDRRYPQALRRAGSPLMLHVAGGVERLRLLTGKPVVAITGSRMATDYGVEMARSLARGLAASGVTVAGVLTDANAAAAHAGALEVGGATLAVVPGGVDTGPPAKRRSLYERLTLSGCAVSELPCGAPARRWAAAACVRIPAALAALTVVVEAEDSPRELAGGGMARTLGRAVAAVPGRVTSPASCGSHALLLDGARLVRGAADVLDLLHDLDAPAVVRARDAQSELEPRLQAMLDRVGAGIDTPANLIGGRDDAGEVLLALSELELMGLLARGDGGRYVPRNPLPVAAPPRR
jgi:DNA processing protein